MDGVEIAAGSVALNQARLAADSGVGILKKAIDASKTEAEALLAAIPEVAPEPLPPVGNVGQHLDIRL